MPSAHPTRLTRRQAAAILLAPLAVALLIPFYRRLGRNLGPGRAWWAGFLIYWPLCLIAPLALVGRRGLRGMVAPGRLGLGSALLMAAPPILALPARPAPRPVAERLALTGTAVVNGVLEEVLWRGLYTTLFPTQPVWAVIWPSLWFGLWHLAPGSVMPAGSAGVLAAGALGLGLALGRLTRQTGSARAAMIAHTVAGVIQAWR